MSFPPKSGSAPRPHPCGLKNDTPPVVSKWLPGGSTTVIGHGSTGPTSNGREDLSILKKK